MLSLSGPLLVLRDLRHAEAIAGRAWQGGPSERDQGVGRRKDVKSEPSLAALRSHSKSQNSSCGAARSRQRKAR